MVDTWSIHTTPTARRVTGLGGTNNILLWHVRPSPPAGWSQMNKQGDWEIKTQQWHVLKINMWLGRGRVYKQHVRTSVECCTVTLSPQTRAKAVMKSLSLSASNCTPCTISTVMMWSSESAASAITRSNWLVCSVKYLTEEGEGQQNDHWAGRNERAKKRTCNKL